MSGRCAEEILAARRVGIYIEEGAQLLFFDPETRGLLRTRPNPLQPGEAAQLQRARSVGPVPRPPTEPIRGQRRASNTGVIMVARQHVALGREHQPRAVTVLVSENTLASGLPDADDPRRAPPRQPRRCIASRTSGHGSLIPQFARPGVAHQVAEIRRASGVGTHIPDHV
jgi:hypothetical protein